MSCQTIKTRTISTVSEFSSSRDAWNELADGHLFHCWEWMFAWWETYQDDGQLSIVVAVDEDGRWVGVAPWFQTSSASRGRMVQTLGSGSACSDYVGVMARPGFESIVGGHLVDIVAGVSHSDLFRKVDLFEFEGHLADDPVLTALNEQMPSDLAHVDCREFAGTWMTLLPDSWPQFESELPKSFRRKTKKAAKRLTSGEFPAEVWKTPDEIREAWPLFVELHQRRRQSLGQPGCFADKRFEQFLLSTTLKLAETGRSQINLIRNDGKPLTCNLEFIQGDRVLMYQTGMDPDRLQLEPGHIMFTRAIQESIERRFTAFDFLRGDEPYKARWNASRLPLYRTRLVPNRLRANLRHSFVTAGRQVKDWARMVKTRIESHQQR